MLLNLVVELHYVLHCCVGEGFEELKSKPIKAWCFVGQHLDGFPDLFLRDWSHLSRVFLPLLDQGRQRSDFVALLPVASDLSPLLHSLRHSFLSGELLKGP